MSGDNTDTNAPSTTKPDASTDAKSSTDTGKEGVKAEDGKSSDTGTKEDVSGLKKANAAIRKERDELAKQIRDGELAKLPELERYKSLSDELTKENQELKTENMRRRVGMELGLPWNIAKRITGTTEDEMREDAADLAKHYKVDTQTGIPEDKKNRAKTNDTTKSGAPTKPGMNEALRALAGRSLS